MTEFASFAKVNADLPPSSVGGREKGAKQMAFRIDGDACTSCGSCLPECAVEAISESTDYYVIDEDTCIDCGACVDVCAFDAISEI